MEDKFPMNLQVGGQGYCRRENRREGACCGKSDKDATDIVLDKFPIPPRQRVADRRGGVVKRVFD